MRQRLPALRDLTRAVDWALPELEFEDVRGLVGEPLRDGEEPAECGSVRRFGGDFVDVDIGQFETPGGGSERGIDFGPERRTATLTRVDLTRWLSSVDKRCAGVKRAVDEIGSCVEGR